MEKQYEKMPIELKVVDKDSFSLEAVFSTDDQDRHMDVVKQNFDLKAFKKNPVLLNSHNYGDASEVIGTIKPISVKEGKLQGKVKFAALENPKAKVIFDLYAGGFLNAFSIGFIPKEFDDEGKIEKSELLEVSAVSVPANAMALAKEKGIEVEKLEEKEEEVEEETGLEPEDVKEDVEPEEITEENKEKMDKIEDKEKEAEERRKRLLNESLAVIRQLQDSKVDKGVKRRQMVNRAIRQLIKSK